MANSVFLDQKKEKETVFDISYYKAFKKYLVFLGQYPYQSQWTKNLNISIIMSTLTSLYIPAVLQFFNSITEKNMDRLMESIPVAVTVTICAIKLLNHSINKDKFDKLFDIMKEEWEFLIANNEAFILGNVTRRGNKLAVAYRTTLLSFLVLFILLPLSPVVLDAFSPRNETRTRHLTFRLNYYVDENEYFYHIYLHSTWCSFIIVIIAISIDSLYMLIVYHCCGLFSVCGYQIKKALESNNLDTVNVSNHQFKKFAIMHERAIKFYKMIDECSCNSYFLQVGFNMINITVTSVHIVMFWGQPSEVIRTLVFLMAQKFHLFVISIRGQMLTDYSSNFLNDIYGSMWYSMPVNSQKLLHTMQIRSCRICKLTAGGLYDMNIENFGTTVKTCMSYFTVLMSIKS